MASIVVPQAPCVIPTRGHRQRNAAVAHIIPRVALSDTPADSALLWSVVSVDGEEDNRDWVSPKPSPALTSYLTASNVLLLHQRLAMT